VRQAPDERAGALRLLGDMNAGSGFLNASGSEWRGPPERGDSQVGDVGPEIVARRLLEVLPELGGALQEGSAVTVEETSVRIRKLPVE
jgi:hypothetical protein